MAPSLQPRRGDQRVPIGVLVQHLGPVESRLLRRFDEQVRPERIIGIVGHRETVRDPRARGEHVALRVRRHRPQSVTERGHRDRVDPVGAACREVGVGVLTVADREQPFPELAFVEAAASPGRDRFERAGDAGAADDLARSSPAGRAPELGGGGVVGQRGDAASEQGGRGEAVTCVAGGRREQPGEGQPTEAFVHRDPTVDTARHRDGPDVVPKWHLCVPLVAQTIRIRTRSGSPARVQRSDRRRVVGDEREQVTAHAAQVRRGDTQHRVRGDRGVHGATAVSDRAQPGLCRQVVDRRDHGVRRVASRKRGVAVVCHRRAR